MIGNGLDCPTDQKFLSSLSVGQSSPFPINLLSLNMFEFHIFHFKLKK